MDTTAPLLLADPIVVVAGTIRGAGPGAVAGFCAAPDDATSGLDRTVADHR